MRNKKRIYYATIVLLVAIVIIIALALAVPTNAAEPIWTNKQECLHQMAQIAREAGYTEDSELIQTLQKLWWEEQDALNIIAKTVKNEAAGVPGAQWCPEWHQVAVAQIIVNRTRLDGFPNTVRGVVSQVLPSGYYAYNPAYCENFSGIEAHYYEVAKYVLDGNAEMEVPADVVYQDNQPHGEIWKTSYVDTGWFSSMTYFCRGVK